MNYGLLATEIAKPAYAGMTDQQKVPALKAGTVAGHVDITIASVFGYLGLKGRLYFIERFASMTLTGTDAVKDAGIIAAYSLFAIRSTNTLFQTSDDAKRDVMVSMLDSFVSNGLIEIDDRAALVAMTEISTPLLQTLGCAELIGMDDDCVVDHLKLARGEDPQEARKAAQ